MRHEFIQWLYYEKEDDGGYQHNLVTGNYLADNKIGSLRGSMVYQPTGDFKVTAIASYSDRNNKGDGPHLYGQGALAANEFAASPSFHDVMVDDEGSTKRKISSAILRVENNTSWGNFTSITGYRHLDASYAEDSDGGPLPLNFPSVNYNKETQFSQEVRLTSPKGRQLEYVAGAYLGYEKLSHSIQFNFNGTIPSSYLSVLTAGKLQTQLVSGDVHTTSFGPYAEGKWHFSEFALKATSAS